MLLVTKRSSNYTYLVNDLSDEKSVCGHDRSAGWVLVEHNEANVHKLTKGSAHAYSKLPRLYFVTLGTPLTFHNVAETDPELGKKTGKFINLTIPKGETMRVVWRDLKRGLTYCDFGGKIVLVGRNSAHKYEVEVQLDTDNRQNSADVADDSEPAGAAS